MFSQKDPNLENDYGSVLSSWLHFVYTHVYLCLHLFISNWPVVGVPCYWVQIEIPHEPFAGRPLVAGCRYFRVFMKMFEAFP